MIRPILIKQISYSLFLVIIFLTNACQQQSNEEQSTDKIDREALVGRHKVNITTVDTLASLSLGNGEFAFTVDITGLQSYPEYYEKGVSLGTQSQWAWHTIPEKESYSLEDVAVYDTSCTGKAIPFPVQFSEGRKGAATHYLRTNPHRLHMGLIGLELLDENGNKIPVTDLKNINQTLDLWTGKIESQYEVNGKPVKVELYGHQDNDEISANITSPLIAENRLKITFKFPYGSDCHVCPGYDFNTPEAHSTTVNESEGNMAQLKRVLDSTTYYTNVGWTGVAELSEREKHYFVLSPDSSQDSFSFNVSFAKNEDIELSDFESTAENSINAWQAFWNSGAAIDFSGSTDPRAKELERRVVLSQYLTKIQCSGSLPPQETGLTMNSWYGKFHIEMHWWHGVHFALWDRLPLLEKSLPWYHNVKSDAKQTAERQDFEGVRWQKMTDPYGNESPSSVGTYLVWQQPHIIYFSELIYRQKPNEETLNKYKDLVFETADFMADFAQLQEDGYYHLCAPLKPAQELFPANETNDPPFELNYWHFGLTTAQEWRKRLGMPENEKWQEVIDKLAPLAVQDGLYLPTASHSEAYSNDFYRRDHPVVLGTLGLLPEGDRIDKEIMLDTYNEIIDNWQWETTWGWDYPMMAMAAAKLGEPEKAVDALFMDLQKNTYLPNGHNYQDDRLRIYLPGNGGLLTAVAMMAAGWDNSPERANPGFPDNGQWEVKWEGLKKMP